MSISKKNILIISPEPWGINFVSKHHYASLLSEKGNTVYFLNPPSATNKVEEVKPNLFVIDYKLNMRGINRMPSFLREFFNKRQINILKENFGKGSMDLVWNFDPYRFQNMKAWGAKKAIYHPVDIHYTDLEKAVVESADYVFATSDVILAKYKPWASHVPKIKINHGLGMHFVSPMSIEVEDFRKAGYKAHVGYVGNLNMFNLDYDLLLQVVKENTDTAFYFIGPYQSSNLSQVNENGEKVINQIKDLPHVTFLGPKPSKELPAYMAYFDVFMLLYKDEKNKIQIPNPHKILEYLSTGKAIVNSFIAEYEDKRELLQMADYKEEIPALFKETIDNLSFYNSPQLIEKRKAYAASQSYEKQLERIAQILEPAKISV